MTISNILIRSSFRVVVIIAISGGSLFAQEFTIKKVELAGENLNIYYDLRDTVAGHAYTINAYSSTDNFVNPLTKVSGDLGLQVKPGLNKKIVWKAKEELGSQFEGKVGLEIRGKVFIPFILLKNFSEYKVFKRLRKYPITWGGGTTRNVLNFDLIRNDKVVYTFAGIGNDGNYDLLFPKEIRPGKNYYLRIGDSKNRDEVIFTEKFTIRRKLPLLLKVLPVAAVGAAIYFLLPDPPPEEIEDPATNFPHN